MMRNKEKLIHDYNELLYLDFKETSYAGSLYYYTFDLYNSDHKLIVECSGEYYDEQRIFKLKTITNCSGEEGKEYASIVLQYVLKKSRDLGAEKVTGFISPWDINTKELKDQVYGFYRKHGAVINENGFEIAF